MARSGIPSGRQAGRGVCVTPKLNRDPAMWRGGRPPARALLLIVLLARLTLPADGNLGGTAGSCSCDRLFPSDAPPKAEYVEQFRKVLTNYKRCQHFIRFQLRVRSVCGHSRDPWVRNLMRCFDHRECGSQHSQQHLLPSSTQALEPTERAPSDMSTPFQPYLPSILQSSQQPTIPAGAVSLDKGLTFPKKTETTVPTVGPSLRAGLEAGKNQKQLDKKLDPTAGSSVMVPVLSLLAIIFILTGALLYMVCRRRQKYFPDLQLHYTPVASDLQHINQPLTRKEVP